MISVPSNDPNAALSILSSIGRFSTLPETRGMIGWLRDELARLDAANRLEIASVDLRQRQGACQVLAKLFELMETADKKAEQIRANQLKKGV